MALRLVSSRPGPGPRRPVNGNGRPLPPGSRPPRRGPPSGAARIIGLVLLALCLIGLYAAFAWQPCAACAAGFAS